MAKHYQWDRYWLPAQTEPALLDGFFADPHSSILNTSAALLEDLDQEDVLVLLGEGGLGKSTTVREEVERLNPGPVHCAAIVDLRHESDMTSLRHALDRNVNGLTETAAERPSLWLDSFDEFVPRFSGAGSALIAELYRRDLPSQGIRLRVVSRAGAWPAELDAKFTESVGAHEAWTLAPLRREDVESALSQAGLDQEKFLRALSTLGAGALAARPLTLRMLLDRFTEAGELASIRSELFEDACRRMLTEHNPERRWSQGVSPEARLALASRLAAASVFTGRWEITTGEQPATTAVALTDVSSGGPEPLLDEDSPPADVSAPLLDEVIRSSSLFSPTADNHVTWSHRSFAEYLAARFALQRGLHLDQLESLLMTPDRSGGRKVAPGLDEVAGWIASARPDFAERLAERDPRALLATDSLHLDDTSRERLVARLLEDLADDPHVYGIREYRLALRHPGLVDQIAPFLRGGGRSAARALAIQIVRQEKLTEVVDTLIECALDEDEPLPLRIDAATACAELRGEHGVIELEPLVDPGDPGDADLELRAVTLEGLWRSSYSTGEVLDALVPPPAGATLYTLFLRHTFPRGMAESDVLDALDWAVEQSAAGKAAPFDDLIEQVKTRALEVGTAPLVDRLARLIASEVESPRWENRMSEEQAALLDQNTDLRRRLLERVVPLLPSESAAAVLRFEAPHLVRPDFDWLSGQLTQAADVEVKRRWARLIAQALQRTAEEALRLLEVAAAEPVLWEVLGGKAFFGPIALDSEDAESLRQLWKMQQPQEPVESPVETVRAILATPHPDWDAVLDELREIEDEMGYAGPAHEGLLRSLEGFDDDDARLIVASALRFLREVPTTDASGSPQSRRCDIAAYEAFMVVAHLDEERLDDLSDDVWSGWRNALISYPWRFPPRVERRVLGRAWDRHPSEVADALTSAIREEVENDGPCVLERWGPIRPAEVDALAVELAGSPRTSPSGVEHLLRDPLRHGRPEAIEVVERLIRDGSATSGAEGDRAEAAAVAALSTTAHGAWAHIWEATRIVPGLRDALTLRLAERHDLDLARLSDSEMGMLVSHLLQQFPPAADPKKPGDIGAHPKADARFLRDGFLTGLARRGALDELAALTDACPDLRALYPHLEREARRAAVARSWSPPAPADVVRLRGERALVESPEHLLDLVSRTIREITARLQEKTSPVRDLWDRVADTKHEKRYRPIAEEEVSDWLARQLDERLRAREIVINREVEITRGWGEGVGARSDIRVEVSKPAPPGAGREQWVVTVEVKGSWNPDLVSGLREQLVKKYMARERDSRGVYLVAWFASPWWDPSDRRRRTARSIDRDKVERVLTEAATSVADEGFEVFVEALDATFPPPSP